MNTNPYRDQATENILRELAMNFLARESNRTSLLTVTNVILSDRGKRVKILFTVLPEDKEKAALDFVKRQREDFRDYIKKNSKLPIIPFVDFDIDYGEKNRQTVDRLI